MERVEFEGIATLHALTLYALTLYAPREKSGGPKLFLYHP